VPCLSAVPLPQPQASCQSGTLTLTLTLTLSRSGCRTKPRTLWEKPHWGAVRVPLMNATTRLSCKQSRSERELELCKLQISVIEPLFEAQLPKKHQHLYVSAKWYVYQVKI